MKKYYRIIAILALLIGTADVQAQEFIVGSFNLRMETQSDTGNLWKNRAPIVTNLIRFHEFDILGTQEGFKNQLDDISTALPEFSRYGKGRDDGMEKGEHSAIFFKKDKFNLLKSGDFWLSQTPNQPSLGWDATCCHRICSWVYLQDKSSGKKFFVFNVHFDHQGKIARVESGKLMVEQIKLIAANEPVLLTGDFNGNRESEWYQNIANSKVVADTYQSVSYPYANNGSSNGFRRPRGFHVIDHIFASKQFMPLKWGILTDTYFGKFPSDHFPVLCKLKLK